MSKILLAQAGVFFLATCTFNALAITTSANLPGVTMKDMSFRCESGAVSGRLVNKNSDTVVSSVSVEFWDKDGDPLGGCHAISGVGRQHFGGPNSGRVVGFFNCQCTGAKKFRVTAHKAKDTRSWYEKLFD